MTDQTEQISTMDAFAPPDDGQDVSTSAIGPLPAAPPRIARHADTEEAEQSEMSTLDQRLATFVGYNTDAYLHYYHEVYSAGWKTPMRHWHWAPFVFTVPWLFSRRRYGIGLMMILAILIAGFMMPGGQGTAIGIAGGALLLGFAGRPIYIASALRGIQAVEARRLWPVQRDERLRRRGALSMVNGIVGALLWTGALAIPYFSGFYL